MAIQHSTAVRDARGEAYETAIGTSPKLEFFTGAQPANCAAADSGTKLTSMSLPADWLSTASGGSAKTLLGSWTTTGIAAGNAGYYRIKNTAGSTCHEQGSITATGGGGDLTLDNISIAVAQNVSITSFSKSEPGA